MEGFGTAWSEDEVMIALSWSEVAQPPLVSVGIALSYFRGRAKSFYMY